MDFSRFVDDFHRKKLSLNILINNAGVIAKSFQKSNDGIESTFAVNHLGHCKLILISYDLTFRLSTEACNILFSRY